MIRVFKTDLIRKQLEPEELSCLEDDFRHYKANGVLPDLFGRDVPYNHPNTLPSVKAEELWHIHLLDGENSWPVIVKSRTTKPAAITWFVALLINPLVAFYLSQSFLQMHTRKRVKIKSC